MKKCLVVLMVLLCVISFAGCRGKPKVLLDTDLLKVEQERGKIDVYDVESNITYTFYIRHKNASKRLAEPYAAVDTPSLRIEQRHKEVILTVKKCKNKYTLRIGKIFPIISVKKGVYNENFR